MGQNKPIPNEKKDYDELNPHQNPFYIIETDYLLFP